MVGEVIGPHKEAIAGVLLNRDAMIVKLPSNTFYSHKMFLLSVFARNTSSGREQI